MEIFVVSLITAFLVSIPLLAGSFLGWATEFLPKRIGGNLNTFGFLIVFITSLALMVFLEFQRHIYSPEEAWTMLLAHPALTIGAWVAAKKVRRRLLSHQEGLKAAVSLAGLAVIALSVVLSLTNHHMLSHDFTSIARWTPIGVILGIVVGCLSFDQPKAA